jgi:hypothetical protein
LDRVATFWEILTRSGAAGDGATEAAGDEATGAAEDGATEAAGDEATGAAGD